MTRIKPGMIVEREGQRGVTVTDLMSCCHEEETPVVWYGAKGFKGTWTDELTVIGPENAVAEPTKCGAGKEAACCIFITAGVKGFVCERHTDMRHSLIFRSMSAKRHPVKPFPECQDLTDGAEM